MRQIDGAAPIETAASAIASLPRGERGGLQAVCNVGPPFVASRVMRYMRNDCSTDH